MREAAEMMKRAGWISAYSGGPQGTAIAWTEKGKHAANTIITLLKELDPADQPIQEPYLNCVYVLLYLSESETYAEE